MTIKEMLEWAEERNNLMLLLSEKKPQDKIGPGYYDWHSLCTGPESRVERVRRRIQEAQKIQARKVN